MYSSSTKATMNAATTRIITKGRSSHQVLKDSQCESAEPRASSEDMGQPDATDVSAQAKCPIPDTPPSRLVSWTEDNRPSDEPFMLFYYLVMC